MKMRRTIFSVCVLALVLASGSVLAADIVTEKSSGNDRKHKGKITRDDKDGVALRVKGGITPEFRREHITKVEYECLQRHFYAGESQFKQGQYEVARIRLEQAADDKSVDVWAKQYVLRRLAQCYQRIGKPENLKKAAKTWEKLRLLIPDKKGVFVKESIRGMLQCYTQLKLWDKASQCLVPLEAMGADGRMMARVFRAQIAERRASSASDFGNAAQRYRQVAESRPRPAQEVRARALAGFARCSVEAKNWGAALEAAKKITAMKGEVPGEALAVAYQVQGEIKLRTMLKITPNALNKDDKKLKKVQDAMLDMLRPVVQYKGSTWAEPRALYYVGFWSEKMERAAQGPKWQRRAQSMYDTVRVSFPGTKWAKLAIRRLAAMRRR
jgi:tetratricopeptide (TPR) repeat protein